jgi:hypothetical protein
MIFFKKVSACLKKKVNNIASPFSFFRICTLASYTFCGCSKVFLDQDLYVVFGHLYFGSKMGQLCTAQTQMRTLNGAVAIKFSFEILKGETLISEALNKVSDIIV